MDACLLQDGHPVAYASWSLTPAEHNYIQILKELLGIVFEKVGHITESFFITYRN